jgi:hypothetical protein
MCGSDMVFEIHNVIKDQPLRLTHWMVAVYLLACWHLLQMRPFNLIHHVERPLVTECPAAIRQALVANTDRALGLCADKREWFKIWRLGIRRFFLDEILLEGGQALLRLWNLAPSTQRNH